MKVTPAKIEANRKNSLKSTGPKTPQGKAVVRYNALKHGILAREAVITEGDGREERANPSITSSPASARYCTTLLMAARR
jgi:hypothetical protein